MLLFYFWVALIIAAVVAVPVAVKMTPGPARPASDPDEAKLTDEHGQPIGDEAGMPADPEAGFGGEEFGAEPLGDDAFEEFK